MAPITNQAQFEAFFGTDTGFPSTDGHWRADSGGSTGSANTGPGTNNTLPFVHTETSGSASLSQLETNGIVQFLTVPSGRGRLLTLRVCIQGRFGDGTEGLEIQHRTGDTATWKQAGFIHGWAYSNSRTVGQTFNDENGVSRTVVANGGWIDADIVIPDTATQVRLHPRYVGAGDKFAHDVAINDIAWGTIDLMPTFGGATVPEQTWRMGVGEALVLPPATGGDPPLTYGVSPALPTGLVFDAARRTIGGIPRALSARREYVYTVRDSDGDTDEIRFFAAVLAPLPPPDPSEGGIKGQVILHPTAAGDRGIQWPGVQGLIEWPDGSEHPLEIDINGIDRTGMVIRRSFRITRDMDSNSTCRFNLYGLTRNFPEIAFGQTVVVRLIGTPGMVLFSGRIHTFSAEHSRGGHRKTMSISATGHEASLGEQILPTESAELAGLATAMAQLQHVVDTGTVNVGRNNPSPKDYAWKAKRTLLTDLQQSTGGILWPEPTLTGVRYHLVDPEGLVAAGFPTITKARAVKARHSLDTQHAVRRQHLLAGDFTRVRTFFGDNATSEWALNDTFPPLDYFDDDLTAYGLGDVFQDRGLRFYEDREVLLTDGSVEIIPSGTPAESTLYIGELAFEGSQWVLFLDRAALEIVMLSSVLLPPPANNLDLLLRHEDSDDKWAFLDAEVQSGGVPTREEDADISPVPPLFDGSPNIAYALFGYNDLIYFGQGSRNNAGFLAYDPETGDASPDDNITGIPSGWQSNAGMTQSAGSLFGLTRDLGVGRSGWGINELRLSDLTQVGGDGAISLLGIPGYPATQRIGITAVDMCSDATTLYVLGYYQSAGIQTVDVNWGLWAFRKTQSTVGSSLLQDEDAAKHIRLPGSGTETTRWTGCALSGSVIGVVSGAANDDNVIFYNRFTKAREPLLDIELPEHAATRAAVAVGEHFHIIQQRGGGFTGSRTLAYTTRDRKLRWTITEAQRDAIVRRAGEDATFRVVMVDGSIAGVDAPNYRFQEGFPVQVRGKPGEFTVTTGGILALSSLGGEGSQWRYSAPKQAIVHSGTPLTDVDRVRVVYSIGWVLSMSGGQGIKDGFEDIADINTREEATTALAALWDANSTLANRIEITLKPNQMVIPLGSKVAMDVEYARELGVPNPQVDDVWVVERTEAWLSGNLFKQKMLLERGKFTSLRADYWRRLRG